MGAGLWGLCTIQLALTSNFVIMIVLRAASLQELDVPGSYGHHLSNQQRLWNTVRCR